ncbi:MAG TPA: 30S ribosomal protein S20 [Patescibacteria group bacterium]|nr:30S ribosomal protein S20 [Patescibacteria group bacterium]
MPVKKSAFKHARQTEKRTARNRTIKRKVKESVKDAVKIISTQPQRTDAWGKVYVAIKEIDKAAQKKVLKKNTAARKKSRLMKQLNTLKTA